MTGLLPAGLPHSDIYGSKVICTSPQLFAAYHVLLRLREPRHPPSALDYFLIPTLFEDFRTKNKEQRAKSKDIFCLLSFVFCLSSFVFCLSFEPAGYIFLKI